MTTVIPIKTIAGRYVVEAYRLDRYDNFGKGVLRCLLLRCRSLSFG